MLQQIIRKTILPLAVLFLVSCASETDKCGKANTDLYESTIGIDIPPVNSVVCYSDDRVNISIFELDTLSSAMKSRYKSPHGYAKAHSFNPFTHTGTLPLKGISHLKEIGDLQFNRELLYYQSGINHGNDWRLFFIPSTGKLYAEIISETVSSEQ